MLDSICALYSTQNIRVVLDLICDTNMQVSQQVRMLVRMYVKKFKFTFHCAVNDATAIAKQKAEQEDK